MKLFFISGLTKASCDCGLSIYQITFIICLCGFCLETVQPVWIAMFGLSNTLSSLSDQFQLNYCCFKRETHASSCLQWLIVKETLRAFQTVTYQLDISCLTLQLLILLQKHSQEKNEDGFKSIEPYFFAFHLFLLCFKRPIHSSWVQS